jgi:hypothetical protein
MKSIYVAAAMLCLSTSLGYAKCDYKQIYACTSDCNLFQGGSRIARSLSRPGLFNALY